MRQDEINRRTFEAPRIVSLYCSGPFQIPEIMILLKYRDDYWGKRILDVGSGAGRTTELLRHSGDGYVSIDYSLGMVEQCQARFPDVKCLHCDARDMREFEDSSFDFVLFSNNGLDCLDHEDRLKAMREINRVLVQGGLYVFSSHNRNYPGALSSPKLILSWDPSRQVRELYRYFKHRANRRRNRRFERFEKDYWILNDSSHSYSLVTHYIDQKTQVSELREVGFEAIEMYGRDGALLTFDGEDRDSPWIYYVAKKIGPPAE